ncbi:MAG TPA: hypothetical protein VIK01_08480 [Polyangiaceae bacterium]
MKLKTALLVLGALLAGILLPMVAGVLAGFLVTEHSAAPRPTVTVRYVDVPALPSGR